MIKTVTLNPAIDKTVEIKEFRVGEVNRISSVRLDPGGKGINVAKTIKALGGSSIATGFLAGRNGQFIQERLEELEVASDFLFVRGDTRTNLKVVDRLNSSNTDINEPGLIEVSEDDLRMLEHNIFSDMEDGDLLVLSGSIPAGVSTDIYREWAEKGKRLGINVFLDADGPSFEEGIKGKPYLIKPNLDELERLLSRKLSSMEEIVSAGRSMLETGIEIVAISLGADGAMFFYGEQVIFAKGIKVDVKSTVGAGDAMVAAFAYAVSNGDSFEKAVILSVASGTANVACEGTQPPDRNAVAQYETQVELNYL